MEERPQSSGAVNCCCRFLPLPSPTYLDDTDHLYHNKRAFCTGKSNVPDVKGSSGGNDKTRLR